MPVKRRIAKRRKLSPEAELAAWRETFDIGHDFFGDLEPLGIEGDARRCMESDNPKPGDAAALEAAREAWARLGAAFMAGLQLQHHKPPWALTALGEPEGHKCR